MDHEIDKQEPSSKEGGQVSYMKGDKVWVLCRVIEPCENLMKVTGSGDDNWFWAGREQCRPVEPDHDDHPVEFKVGDRVVSWSGRQGVVEAINEIEGFPITVRHSMREQVSYKLGGVKHDDHPVEQAPKETMPKEPTQGQKLAERTMKAIWAANDAVSETPVVKHGDPSGGWEPTKDEIEYAKDRCGVPIADPIKVGDAVRIKQDTDKATPLVVRSWQSSGSSNTPIALCVSECGKRIRWTALEEMERIEPADPINPAHYKQGGIECIEAIKAATGDGFIGYVWGNVLKYLWRWPKKGGVEDLKKARWYLDRLIKEVGE
jgi:hypothetical protein